MKVIYPSFKILDEYFQKGKVLEQIERCGRVCYKSEDKITEESAIPFIKGIIKRGHESVIEMANLVMEVEAPQERLFKDFFIHIPRFCQASRLTENLYLISGNPRSFRDLARRLPNAPLICAIKSELQRHYPVLFEDLETASQTDSKLKVRLLLPKEVDNLETSLLVKHRCLLTHIIVNRAVTHELVRHRVASYLQESQRYCRYGEEKFGGQVTFIRPCFFDEGTPQYELWERAMKETEAIYLELLKNSSPQAARTVLPNSCKTEIMVHATLEEWQHIFRLRASKAADPSMREIMLMMLPEFAKKFPKVFEDILKSVDQ